MVMGKFRRSESFPAQPAGTRAAAAKSTFRARCISLPSRTHPLAAHLAEDLRSLHSWPPPFSSADGPWISDGLARLRLLLAGLADVLHLPQALDPLRRSRSRSPALADRILDDFLRLADAHGSFLSAALDLKRQLADSQIALRRRDEPLLASCLRDLRHAGKELAEIAAAVREVRRRSQQGSVPATESDAEEAEVARFIWEVAASVAEASAAVFLGVAEMSTAAAAEVAPSRVPWAAAVLRWKARATSKPPNKKWRRYPSPEENGGGGEGEGEEKWRRTALEKLGAAEDAFATMQNGVELVFRSLVHVRVTLLNILTPGFC